LAEAAKRRVVVAGAELDQAGLGVSVAAGELEVGGTVPEELAVPLQDYRSRFRDLTTREARYTGATMRKVIPKKRTKGFRGPIN